MNSGEEKPSGVQERLAWQVATRDDARVAQGRYAGEESEEMHELSAAGLLDEFFAFLEESGMMAILREQELPGVQRVLIPSVQFLLLYVLKVLMGAESMNQLPRVLFSHIAVMELIGFNARQIEEGLTKRGDGQRAQKQEKAGTTDAAVPGREYLQTGTRADGAPLQPDGAGAGGQRTAHWQAPRGSGWLEIANSCSLGRRWQAETNA